MNEIVIILLLRQDCADQIYLFMPESIIFYSSDIFFKIKINKLIAQTNENTCKIELIWLVWPFRMEGLRKFSTLCVNASVVERMNYA